jgi:type II secretory pathway pseudopilin PulG
MSRSHCVSYPPPAPAVEFRQSGCSARSTRGRRGRPNLWRGLTLLELVIVLGILAALSAVAVRSLEPLADQARYEATQRLLDDLRAATLGEAAQRPARLPAALSGFVADTGELPTSVEALLALPPGLAAHAVQNFDSDRDGTPDVTLSSGWRGPYLHLGAGQSELLDGWGRPTAILPAGAGIAFVSFGSDGDSDLPEDRYAADLSVTILPGDYLGELIFRLFAIDSLGGSRIDPAPAGLERLGILLYAVNAAGGSAGEIEEQLLTVPSAGSFELRRSATCAGTIAARAILWNDANSNSLFDPGETIVKKSYVHYTVVAPSTDVRLEMELR